MNNVAKKPCLCYFDSSAWKLAAFHVEKPIKMNHNAVILEKFSEILQKPLVPSFDVFIDSVNWKTNLPAGDIVLSIGKHVPHRKTYGMLMES